jgi:hypothetical protein
MLTPALSQASRKCERGNKVSVTADIHRMPPPTTANMTGIGDFLKRITGSMAPRRARGVRNGRHAVNYVQSGAVMAHVSRQFESNASACRLLPG